MVTFALCTAFGVFLCWQFSKAYFLGKKKHKELLADGYKFEVVDTSRLMMSVYLAAIVVAVCLFVYSIVNIDTFELWETGISTGSLVTCMAIGKMLSSSVFHKFYYDDDVVLYINQVYRWKGIKSITTAKRSLFKSSMNLYNGKSVTIPKKIGMHIDQMMAEKKKK